jgi:ketosteroid isomerase-like protein
MKTSPRRAVLAFAFLAALPAIAHALPDATPSPEAVANQFYTAFCAHDPATLAKLYAPDVQYQDTIFTFTDRAGVMGMWGVLDAPSSGKFSYQILSVEGDVVTVHWDAYYAFPLTGRPVHNSVMAELTVKDGLIVQHHDSYPWGAWAAQAFPFGASVSSWGPVKAGLMGVVRTAVWVAEVPAKLEALMPASKPTEAAPPETPGVVGKLGAADR